MPAGRRQAAGEGVRSALADGHLVGEMGRDQSPRSRGAGRLQTVIEHRNVEGRLDFFSTAHARTRARRESGVGGCAVRGAHCVDRGRAGGAGGVITADFRTTSSNSRYEDHSGVDKSFLLGKTVLDVIGEQEFRDLPAVPRARVVRASRGVRDREPRGCSPVHSS